MDLGKRVETLFKINEGETPIPPDEQERKVVEFCTGLSDEEMGFFVGVVMTMHLTPGLHKRLRDMEIAII